MMPAFSKPSYPIIYTRGFLLFWGFGIGISYLCGGFFAVVVAAACLFMLVRHEFAHLKKCEEYHVPVHSLTFTAWGGLIDARMPWTQEGIEIYKAGVLNSAYYAAVFLSISMAIRYVGTELSWNFADPMPGGLLYYMQLTNSLTLASVALVVTNCLPFWWYSKKHGLVTFDGCAVFLRREARDEFWNDGKIEAIVYDEAPCCAS